MKYSLSYQHDLSETRASFSGIFLQLEKWFLMYCTLSSHLTSAGDPVPSIPYVTLQTAKDIEGREKKKSKIPSIYFWCLDQISFMVRVCDVISGTKREKLKESERVCAWIRERQRERERGIGRKQEKEMNMQEININQEDRMVGERL